MQLSGRIVTPGGVVVGSIAFERRIVGVTPGEAPDRWILPGFVDLHLHGGDGGDVMAGAEGLRRAARFHLRCGTTSILPTTLTAPFAQLERALAGVRDVIAAPGADEARVLGAHLEGPWISPDRLGAQPPHARAPEAWEVERLLEMAPVRVVTVAPEVAGVPDLIGDLASRGIRVQIGHTGADAAQALRALSRGATGFTHLFNAMTGLHHRAPGAVAAALAQADWAEVIVDGHHVDEVAFRAARRAIPGLYVVSDAIAPTGLGDGEYDLGGHPVAVRGGAARMPDGTLAGSIGTLADALRQLAGWGIEIPEAARRLATVPADYLDRQDLGRLTPGAVADLVELDEQLRVRRVWREGRQIGTEPAAKRG